MGLLGGGGGIIAVPLLIALGLTVREASTASLVIVGLGALAGLIPHHLARRVDWRVGITFGVLGAAGAIAGARLGVSVDPAVIAFTFPILLIAATIAMLRSAQTERAEVSAVASGTIAIPPDETAPARIRSWPLTIALATCIGLITGFFGVGGGFIVVPALVTAIKMPVRRATATGLVVIAINSAVALVARHGSEPAWRITLTMAAATAACTIVGALLSRRIPGWMLSAGFGALTLLIAAYTVVRLFVVDIK
jgi:uncharacterized membrane protein YfcA